MSAPTTSGKRRGLDAVSNVRGVIAALAMDQRGSLKTAIARAGGGPVTDEMIAEVKSAVTEVLTPYASAVLLDPEWGLAAARRRAPGTGLLLAYERSGYDTDRPGRLPDLLATWSVRRLVEAGADAVKLLLYYTPFDAPEVNEAKHAFVERVGDECRANDVPFFLEFLGYDPAGGSEDTLEFARLKPQIVARSMAEFSNARYGVDVLKVEVPVDLRYVEGTRAFRGVRAYTRAAALDAFRKAAAAATRPFIYLSAGVSNAQFCESLELAAEAGVRFSGVLCGRAIWKEGLSTYAQGGLAAFRRWLETEGVANITRVTERLGAAHPWHSVVTPPATPAPAASPT